MDFTASVISAQADFDVRWGDTTRERDIYTPYFKLTVHLCSHDAEASPELTGILLYAFRRFPANVLDEFDEEACLQSTKFADLTTGSKLHVHGPVHRKLTGNKGTLFRGYDYVVLHPEQHGRELDVNGWWHEPVTEWLIEEAPVEDGCELRDTARLIVAWECADLV